MNLTQLNELKSEVEEKLSLVEAEVANADGVAATQTLTVAVNPTADDTMTIGGTVYTFVASAEEATEISVGENLAATQDNILAAINGTDEINTAHASVSCGDFESNVATLTALSVGTAGNSIATTETFTSGSNVFGGGTLENGEDAVDGPSNAFRKTKDLVGFLGIVNNIVDGLIADIA